MLAEGGWGGLSAGRDGRREADGIGAKVGKVPIGGTLAGSAENPKEGSGIGLGWTVPAPLVPRGGRCR
jgi:hypothetical protein